MKSLSEMIEIRRMTKPVDVLPIPFGDIGVIESEDKSLWELATRNGVMTFSVDYHSLTAVCQVARDNTIHTVVRVDVVWNFEAVDAADRIHADMMNVIRNIAKIHGCNAEIYDERDQGKTYRMFDDFDEEEKILYINFTRKLEEEQEDDE